MFLFCEIKTSPTKCVALLTNNTIKLLVTFVILYAQNKAVKKILWWNNFFYFNVEVEVGNFL